MSVLHGLHMGISHLEALACLPEEIGNWALGEKTGQELYIIPGCV